jgi:hypothetical protein
MLKLLEDSKISKVNECRRPSRRFGCQSLGKKSAPRAPSSAAEVAGVKVQTLRRGDPCGRSVAAHPPAPTSYTPKYLLRTQNALYWV